MNNLNVEKFECDLCRHHGVYICFIHSKSTHPKKMSDVSGFKGVLDTIGSSKSLAAERIVKGRLYRAVLEEGSWVFLRLKEKLSRQLMRRSRDSVILRPI